MASALAAAGFLSFVQGEYVTAMGQLERALLLYRELGDRLGTSDVLDHMGLVLVRAGVDLDRAEAALEESQALGLETGSNDRVLYARWHLGDVAQARGDYRRAAALYRERLIQVREKGDEWVRGLILFSFGVLAWLEADHDRAAVLLRQSLRVRQTLEDRIGDSTVPGYVGRVSRSPGRDGACGETIRGGRGPPCGAGRGVVSSVGGRARVEFGGHAVGERRGRLPGRARDGSTHDTRGGSARGPFAKRYACIVER